MITIDGAAGEGGGQILRSALTLSMATGQPFRIVRIRANRPKPGMLRQHLTCVRAAMAISGAQVTGADIGSSELTFEPQQVRGGEYSFAINSAGSTTLVLQTVLPALVHAGAITVLRLQGGTHNPQAPPFEFIERAFLPLMRSIGWDVTAKLERPGFYPAGGGKLIALVGGAGPARPLRLTDRGVLVAWHAEALVANLPSGIAEREVAAFGNALGWQQEMLSAREVKADGPGNVLMATLEFDNVTEVVSSFGMPAVRAERVGAEAAALIQAYIIDEMPVGEHLADQLLVPLALGAGGAFTTAQVSQHFETNRDIIRSFLGNVISVTDQEDGYLVQVTAQ
jgi:RNA 3'-terminal phosphate cyclase (ATP)